MESTSRSESAVALGQWLAKELLEAPVKEAVREALAEERATGKPDERPRYDEEVDGTGGVSVTAVVVGLAALAAVAYLLRKRGDDGDSPTRPSDVDGSTAAGDRVEAQVPVETDGAT